MPFRDLFLGFEILRFWGEGLEGDCEGLAFDDWVDVGAEVVGAEEVLLV